MKRFNEDFRTRLYDTIKDIESNSSIEIVVLIKPRSGPYRDIFLWISVLFSFILYTFFMFSPINFDVFVIYAFTVLSFFAVFGLLNVWPGGGRVFIPKKRMEKEVEIYARALFQKGGLRFTSQHIGTLIYFSLYEKKVYILPDRGALVAVPEAEWNKIQRDFQSVFTSPEINNSVLNVLASCKTIFSTYIPPIENDINELPDDLNIELYYQG